MGIEPSRSTPNSRPTSRFASPILLITFMIPLQQLAGHRILLAVSLSCAVTRSTAGPTRDFGECSFRELVVGALCAHSTATLRRRCAPPERDHSAFFASVLTPCGKTRRVENGDAINNRLAASPVGRLTFATEADVCRPTSQ